MCWSCLNAGDGRHCPLRKPVAPPIYGFDPDARTPEGDTAIDIVKAILLRKTLSPEQRIAYNAILKDLLEHIAEENDVIVRTLVPGNSVLEM